jgi:hypothetical protein
MQFVYILLTVTKLSFYQKKNLFHVSFYEFIKFMYTLNVYDLINLLLKLDNNSKVLKVS